MCLGGSRGEVSDDRARKAFFEKLKDSRTGHPLREYVYCTAVFSVKLARPNYTIGYPVLDE